MATSKNKVTIPPPKFHDFAICGASPDPKLDSNVIWEIGVPEKNSLPWSIILSYLYLSNDSDFNEFLQKLTGDDEAVGEIKKKKNLTSKPLNTYVIRQQLNSFNPFKNRHAFFHQAKDVTEVFRIFDLRLKRYGNELKKKSDDWNDDFKLNAASLLLNCKIEVHFPSEGENQKVASYPKSLHQFQTKMILFQYENQEHGKRSGINIFRFGMSVQQANPLKLDALIYFLKKAKIASESIIKVREIMKNPECHGKAFLTTIFKNKCGDILQGIYKSPYIALRINEAGFETDPLANSPEKLSVFAYAVLYSNDSKYLSILYDYAANCRCLFDHSVRRASDKVLETLKKIKTSLEMDVSELSKDEYRIKFDSLEGTLNVLQQFIAYAGYQFEANSDLNNLRKKFQSSTKTEIETFKFRKSVIESVLTYYQNYFYYNLERLSTSISDKFSNYLNFTEYYKNTDSFGNISFFDNFYQLRFLIDLKQENFFLNIEWKMFVAILFNNYFPECHYLEFDVTKYQRAETLRYVPLLHRNALQSEIPRFLNILQNASDSSMLQKSLKTHSSTNDSNALPMVIDVLIKIRLDVHIQAALEVSVDGDTKSILVIERALQIIGESIKPPSPNNGIISYFLRSCLSTTLQTFLVSIRNDLSHKRCNSIYGRLTTEKDVNFFRKMQHEIAEIKEQFEVVFFTQLLRIEESAMFNCIKRIENELEEDVREQFYNEYAMCVSQRVKFYEKNRGKCMQLLFDTLSDLQNHLEKGKKDALIDQLKSVAYLIGFILRHDNSFKDLNELNVAIKSFFADSENKEMDLFKNDLRCFLTKWISILRQNKITGQRPLSIPSIESFIILLKTDLFSNDEESQVETAILYAYEESIDARNKLEKLLGTNESKELEICLKKIFLPLDKINSLRNYFNSKSCEKALKLLKDKRFPKEQLEKDIKDMFQPCVGLSPYFKILLTKITYQKYLNIPIYYSVKLSDHILEKLEIVLTKPIHLLVERIKSMKNILIDEDEEIKQTWIWGKSREIKYHMKFLMRQRYMRDITVRAALDMAFFDCVNVLHNKPDLSDLYVKSTDLFSGIDLRNVLSHRTNIPETVGGILDEDDFPSTMIEKILQLIDDLEAIESTLELFPKVGILEEEEFVKWKENTSEKKYMKEITAIRECERWDKYLFLFPFIKNLN